MKPEPKNRKTIVVPIGMTGQELKQLKIFDHDAYYARVQKLHRKKAL